jgi:delta14-sterol reductase
MIPAWLWPVPIYALVLALNLAVPGKWVDGYVKGANGKPLRYHLNGLRVFVLVVGGWAAACWNGLWPWGAFFDHRWELAAGACVLGLIFTFAIVLPAAPTPGRSLPGQLYLGRLENPQALGGRLDAKMILYLVGAIMLELNVLSFAGKHFELHPEDPSPGVLLYAAMFSFFIVEYLNFENVHLYTYDFMAERVGFKLGWGCLVFYPFFYPVGLWVLADQPNPHTPVPLLAACAAMFFTGWMLARGANLQKYHFKQDPKRRPFGMDPKPIKAGQRLVLSGGFWGMARHINYLGEILMATGLTLSLGYPLSWAWLYPLYYVALLVPRQADDDRRCAEKYGDAWAEYRRRVPWRIIPRVF